MFTVASCSSRDEIKCCQQRSQQCRRIRIDDGPEKKQAKCDYLKVQVTYIQKQTILFVAYSLRLWIEKKKVESKIK